MLVENKRREEALKVCTTLGNSCSDKETGAMAKLLIIIGIQIPVLLLYLQTCVEFYRMRNWQYNNE
jgi:hypothetical protein